MQKQPTGKNSCGQISYLELPLPAEFPVYIFSYIQGFQDWSHLHFHNGVEIGLCLEGEGLFLIENHILPFSAGDISFIFPDQPHIARSALNAPSQWYFITVDFPSLFCGEGLAGHSGLASLFYNQSIGKGRSLPGILSGNRYPQLPLLIQQVIQELEGKNGRYRERTKALLWTFLLHLLDIEEGEAALPSNGMTLERNAGSFAVLSPALTQITNRYYESFSVRDLAAACNLSENHFRRLFRQTMGCPPLQYIHQVRLRMARALLRSTQMPIAQIAEDVGFSSLSSFNRQFQESFGFSPRQWREKKV